MKDVVKDRIENMLEKVIVGMVSDALMSSTSISGSLLDKCTCSMTTSSDDTLASKIGTVVYGQSSGDSFTTNGHSKGELEKKKTKKKKTKKKKKKTKKQPSGSTCSGSKEVATIASVDLDRFGYNNYSNPSQEKYLAENKNTSDVDEEEAAVHESHDDGTHFNRDNSPSNHHYYIPRDIISMVDGHHGKTLDTLLSSRKSMPPSTHLVHAEPPKKEKEEALFSSKPGTQTFNKRLSLTLQQSHRGSICMKEGFRFNDIDDADDSGDDADDNGEDSNYLGGVQVDGHHGKTLDTLLNSSKSMPTSTHLVHPEPPKKKKEEALFSSKPGTQTFNKRLSLTLHQSHRGSICMKEGFQFNDIDDDSGDDADDNGEDSNHLGGVKDNSSVGAEFKAAYHPDEMRCLALVSHNGMKEAMQSFVVQHKNVLKKFRLTGTASTMKMLHHVFGDDADIVFGPACHSGPLGGDAELVAMMTQGTLGGIFFFEDPMASHPHQHDIDCLVRQAMVHNTLIVTTPTTAMLTVEGFRQALIGNGRPELIPSFFLSLECPTVEAYKTDQAAVVQRRCSSIL